VRSGGAGRAARLGVRAARRGRAGGADNKKNRIKLVEKSLLLQNKLKNLINLQDSGENRPVGAALMGFFELFWRTPPKCSADNGDFQINCLERLTCNRRASVYSAKHAA
jgi:hypothetical protein